MSNLFCQRDHLICKYFEIKIYFKYFENKTFKSQLEIA